MNSKNIVNYMIIQAKIEQITKIMVSIYGHAMEKIYRNPNMGCQRSITVNLRNRKSRQGQNIGRKKFISEKKSR
jgi:hypothetical protein